MIARLMMVNFLTKTETNIGKLRLSYWKTIQVMKIKRVQSSYFTNTLKGYLSQIAKLWKELVELINRDMKKATTAGKRRSKLQLENGKLSLFLKVYSISFYFQTSYYPLLLVCI